METEAFEETLDLNGASSDSDEMTPQKKGGNESALIWRNENASRREATRRLDILAQRVAAREAKLYAELGYEEIDELWLRQQVDASVGPPLHALNTAQPPPPRLSVVAAGAEEGGDGGGRRGAGTHLEEENGEVPEGGGWRDGTGGQRAERMAPDGEVERKAREGMEEGVGEGAGEEEEGEREIESDADSMSGMSDSEMDGVHLRSSSWLPERGKDGGEGVGKGQEEGEGGERRLDRSREEKVDRELAAELERAKEVAAEMGVVEGGGEGTEGEGGSEGGEAERNATEIAEAQELLLGVDGARDEGMGGRGEGELEEVMQCNVCGFVVLKDEVDKRLLVLKREVGKLRKLMFGRCQSEYERSKERIMAGIPRHDAHMIRKGDAPEWHRQVLEAQVNTTSDTTSGKSVP